MTTPDIEFENSSGNVFTDLGLETRKSFTRAPRSALKSSRFLERKAIRKRKRQSCSESNSPQSQRSCAPAFTVSAKNG